MLPVLRLPAKRALPALVPFVAADGLPTLADDHAPALADAVTVLCAEVAQEVQTCCCHNKFLTSTNIFVFHLINRGRVCILYVYT